jgi:hypothetical protein
VKSAEDIRSELAAGAAALLRRLAATPGPGADPIAAVLVDWPPQTEQRGVLPSARPVLRFLPGLARAAPAPTQPLMATLNAAALSLSWRQTYAEAEVGAAFLQNYAWAEIIGLSGAFASTRMSCGFLLLGPATVYPRHRHPAEEIYVPLAGAAEWQQGDARWRRQPVGAVVHHAGGEAHSMRTAAVPLAALYLWHGDGLDEKARLEPA